ncbi:MAG: hypothetical protein KDC95_21090 [Planctomycetes bacterium]|nr:hypothetical protein [Planctomycetota bacterium]
MPVRLFIWGFLAWALCAGYASFSRNRYHHEFDARPQLTERLAAGETITWRFERASARLERLEIFVQLGDHAFVAPVRARLLDAASGRVLREVESEFVADLPRLRFAFALDVSASTALRLEIDGTRETERAGLRLVYSADPEGMLQVDGARHEATSLNHFWCGLRGSPAGGTVAVGILLFLWLAFRAPRSTERYFALGACSFGVAFVVAWELHARRVAVSPWQYWPDYSALLARSCFEFLGGHVSWSDFTEGISSCRKGHVLLVPCLLGVLQGVLSLADAFFLVVTVFALASWALVMVAVHGPGLSRFVAPVALALFACNPCVLRAMGSLQTDIVGIFLAMAAVMSVSRLWTARSSQVRVRYAACSVGVLIATAFTRLALCPLLLLPALPLAASLRRGSSASRVVCGLTLLLPVIVVGSTWLLIGAFESIALARQVAAENRYVDAFQWGGLWDRSLRASHVMLPVVLGTAVFRRRAWKVSREFWVACLAATLLIGLLAGARVVPWMRFQSPVFAVLFLASLASCHSLRSRRAGSRGAVALGSVGIVLQLWDLWRHAPLFY